VDRAKRRLMQQGKTEEEAYRAIQDLARSRRITMRAAAEELMRKTAG
jgi:AmiR/NasT family two-component response regulator